MFSTQSVTQIITWTTLKMSSANAFKLDWSQILSFGKELNGAFRSFLNISLLRNPFRHMPQAIVCVQDSC